MNSHNDHYATILKENGGFSSTDEWLNFARTHNFKKTKSKKLKKCPDCSGKKLKTFGQYIYYSNIIHVKYCLNCGLYFSNTILDYEVITRHFENTYKDEFYFSQQRNRVFNYISRIIDKHTQQNGKAIDIGGGKGHLANMVLNIRPDITMRLNDLSEQSCKFCTDTYGIESFCCNIPDLLRSNEYYNTISLIDVIYYEPKLAEMFEALEGLLVPGNGTVIIRIPNKLPPIKAYQFLLNTFGSNKRKLFQSNIKHFNPEHIYIFSLPYLRKKLRNSGFSNIRFVPSPLLTKKTRHSFLGTLAFHVANAVARLSSGRLILTPSVIVVANNHGR